MRYRLQYLYSVVVFFGVLACSYFMVSQESNAPGIPFRTIEAPPLRAEASPLDPGVSQLFEVEKALSKNKREKKKEIDRESGREITKSPEVDEE